MFQKAPTSQGRYTLAASETNIKVKKVIALILLSYSCSDKTTDNNHEVVEHIKQSKIAITKIDTTKNISYRDSALTIYFDHNSSTIKPIDIQKLDKLSKLFGSDLIGYVKIAGFTDTIGSEKHNDKLAEKRVMKIINILYPDEETALKKSYATWLGESDETYDLHYDSVHPHQNCVDIWFTIHN